MRFRMGVAMGFAGGYVMGSRAGKERYEQIRARAQRVWTSPEVEKIKTQAADAVGDLKEKAMHRGRTIDLDRRTEIPA